MTIGQKIAQLRKEHHLSQEELGNELGVSRQSIYKWESDASLPEIEKLIALSRLFSVSVGWLLGVEETAAPPKDSADEASDTLTDEQLKMVEEITERYIASQPKSFFETYKKPLIAGVLVLAIAAGALISALSASLHQQSDQLQDVQKQMTYLKNDIVQLQGNMGATVDRVEEILKSQNQLTASYETKHLHTDIGANSVSFFVSAVPKTYKPDMRAVFTATQGETKEITEMEGTLGANMAFSAELTCPLSNDITLGVTFISGEKKENQFLEQYQYLYSATIPSITVEGLDLNFSEWKKGILDLHNKYLVIPAHCNTAPVEDETEISEIRTVRPGLFKNGELIAWAEPSEPPYGYTADYGEFFALPKDLEVPMTEEDTLSVTALLTDEYGREFFSAGLENFALTENGRTILVWGTGSAYDRIPKDPMEWID